MAIAEKELHRLPKISEIESLDELKPYSCPKNMHLKEWYLKCLDCTGLKTCMTGKQAVKLMEESTAAHKKAVPDPKSNLREYIEYVFTHKDPIRFLLQDNAAKNTRPTSLYNRVYIWKKNNPDLEEKYHMLEKVRFLWKKPWSSMTLSDILKKMYPEEGPEHDFNGKYADVKMQEVSTVAEQKAAGNTISLEDFLNGETISETKPAPEKQKAVQPAQGNYPDNLDILMEKLRGQIAEYEQKIQETQDKIQAILTVQNLMRNGV